MRTRAPPSFTTISKLPELSAGWFEHSYSVLSDGSLAMNRVGQVPTGASHAHRGLQGDVRFHLSRMHFGVVSDEVEVSAPTSSIVSRFVDGRSIFIAPRIRRNERNAQIYSLDGRLLNEFSVGDAVQEICTTPSGALWVGYFDEQSDTAVASYNEIGSRLWNWPAVSDWALDCYALSATGDDIWTYTYPEFPICRISNGNQSRWNCEVAGAYAIAAKGEHVILAGGYDNEADRILLLHLRDHDAELISEFRCPTLTDRRASVSGRDGVLHVIQGGEWRCLSIADWLRHERA